MDTVGTLRGTPQAHPQDKAQSRLSGHCTSLASICGDIASLRDALTNIVVHLTGNSGPESDVPGMAGAKAGTQVAPVTGLLDDAEHWRQTASAGVERARKLAGYIEQLVSK